MKFSSVELLLPFAEMAGSSGTDWLTWSCSDEAIAAFRDLAPNDEQCAAIVAAHARGWRGHKIASGWVRQWTTAPAYYDQWSTIGTVVGEYSGKPLREVTIDPRYLIAQCDRYYSGAVFLVSEVDPRIADAERAAKRDRWAREDAERAAKREAGIAWLRDQPDSALEDYDELEARCLTIDDRKAERRRRAEEREAATRAADWNALAPLIPIGGTLVYEGREGNRFVQAQPAQVWRGLSLVVPHDPDVDKVEVRCVRDDGSPGTVGTVRDVAYGITEGHFRAARDGEILPTSKVLARAGGRWDRARGVQLPGGDTYWLVRESPLQPEIVVDRAGRLVRKQAVADAVRIAASRLAPYLASKAAPDAGDGSYYVACVTYSGNAGLVRGPWRYRGAAEAAIPAVIADAVMEDSKAGGYAWCVIAAPGDELGHPILGAPADPDAAPPAPVAKRRRKS